MADKFLCRACSKEVTATKNRRYRSHTDGSGEPCEMSSAEIPDDLEPTGPGAPDVPKEGEDYATCPQCRRKIQLTRLGYFPKHTITLRGDTLCDTTGVRMKNLVDTPLPGDPPLKKSLEATTRPKVSNQKEVEESKPKGVPLALPAGSGASTESPSPGSTTSSPPELPVTDAVDWSDVAPTPSPESTSTSGSSEKSSAGSEPSDTSNSSSGSLPALKLGRRMSAVFSQPDSPYLQPPEWKEPPLVFLQPEEWTGTPKPGEMTPYAKEVAARIKETFYSYDNRKSSDNRSAQTTLGPSEIGTPCDRRLAMALMNVPPVNPGGDGWAAFVGTCGHLGMGEIYTFANAGTGRYVVEMPLVFPSAFVPKGTSDLLDRRYGDITDWKFMGDYSLKKFKLNGPSDTYRVQAQTYGLGAKQAGETVRRVVIVGLPRAGGSLDDMWVWEEKFDPAVGKAALKRVEDIAKQQERNLGLYAGDPMAAAGAFDTADDCRYCPFHLKTDKEMRRGCPGT